jgi:hypothetical protein
MPSLTDGYLSPCPSLPHSLGSLPLSPGNKESLGQITPLHVVTLGPTFCILCNFLSNFINSSQQVWKSPTAIYVWFLLVSASYFFHLCVLEYIHLVLLCILGEFILSHFNHYKNVSLTLIKFLVLNLLYLIITASTLTFYLLKLGWYISSILLIHLHEPLYLT